MKHNRKAFDSSEYHKALNAWDRIHCLACGAVLPPYESRKPKPNVLSILSKCCNADCKKEFLRKTLKNWAEFRLGIIKRDRYTCRDCGYIAPMGFDWEFEDYDWKELAKFGNVPQHMDYVTWKFQCGIKAKITRKWQTDKNLEVHHEVPISNGGNEYDDNNCITLCHDCHRLGRHGAAPKTSTAESRLQQHKGLNVSLDAFAAQGTV